MRVQRLFGAATVLVFAGVMVASLSVPVKGQSDRDGRQLFERETFGGNGRTCLTCHSRKTGTVSPADARARFLADPHDPLFLHDGSDDGLGHGVTRMLTDATILMKIALPPNMRFAATAKSNDRFVTVRRGIPSTLNTPALDPTIMLDGRQPSLELQAQGAILDHAQAPAFPELGDLESLRFFQQTDLSFFSSFELKIRSLGGPGPHLPRGTTASERRGRRFFEDVPPDPSAGFKPGLCAHCHSGTLMNQTNEFAPLFLQAPIPTATRFINILVGLFNKGNQPVQDFIFSTPGGDVPVSSTDPGRALITGNINDLDAFKISPLRGIRKTGPYFHDNSAKTLEEVAAHYTRFFAFVTDPDGPDGPLQGFLQLTPQDEADIVAFLKLLD
jgi:cytochrome c peroxidase